MRNFGLILLALLACGLMSERAEARHPYRVHRAYVVGHPVRAYYAPVVPVVPVVTPYYGGPAYAVPPAYYGGPSPFIHPPVYGGYYPYGW